MLEVSETVRLPVGIHKDGQVYREVVIDEMIGLDEENLANPKYKKAPERAVTALLTRCVQEIKGLVPRKKSPMLHLDAKLFQQMFVMDREYLVLMIRMLSYGEMLDAEWTCEKCGAGNTDTFDLRELEVVEWPDDQDPSIPFELPRGIRAEDGTRLKTGSLRFPRGYEAEMMSKMALTNPNEAPTAMLTSIITGIDGVKPDRTMLQRMASRDRSYLGDLLGGERPGVRMLQTASCGACGELNEEVGLSSAGFFSASSTL